MHVALSQFQDTVQATSIHVIMEGVLLTRHLVLAINHVVMGVSVS